MVANPVVSIGLPVCNGENYLACAVESILDQSFTEFELIISDNASTDATPDICRRYVARDARVRYVRNQRNIGAAANFNRALAQAAGRYCKWMAHDDVLAPDFLATSIAMLQAQPDAVLCYSAAEIIDRHGNLLFTDDSRLAGTEGPRPSDRFAEAIINQHMCFPIFALIRAEALRTSSLLANYDGSDRSLVAELALRGRFAYVPRPLFQNRDHPERYIRAVRPQRASALDWWAGRTDGRAVLHLWALYGDYFRMVRRELPDPLERLRCYRSLIRWLAVDWNAIRLLVEVVALIDPRVFDLARSVKQGLLGRPNTPGSDGAQPVRRAAPHDARNDRVRA
jgi:glycosyltransferase involved in cell wall biosynthesis